MKKFLVALAAALMLCALVAPLRGEIIEQVLVKVNGDIITKTELEAASDRRASSADEPGRQSRSAQRTTTN